MHNPIHTSIHWLRGLLALALATSALAIGPSTAEAQAPTTAVINVETTLDSGQGTNAMTLRRALALATFRQEDTVVIRVPAGTYNLTFCGDGYFAGDLYYSDFSGDGTELVIWGEGSGAKIVQTCDGKRVLTAQSGSPVVLTNVELTNGHTTQDGGGIHFTAWEGGDDPRLVLGLATVIKSNTAKGNGGGVWSSGRVLMYGARLENNWAGIDPETWAMDGTASGGGAYVRNDSNRSGPWDVELVRTVVADNEAGGDGGGVDALGGSVALRRTTVARNDSGGSGGGIRAGFAHIDDSEVTGNAAPGSGGGLWAERAWVFDSTVSANESDDGAAALTLYDMVSDNSTFSGNNGQTAVFSIGDTNLRYTTVTANTGAGIVSAFGPSVTLTYSVIAGNGTDCYFNSPDLIEMVAIGNFVGDGTCLLSSFGGNTPAGGDPLLGPLTDNGGPTLTHAPEPGSPVVDVLPVELQACAGTDQRGVARPQGPACDIGAVER